MDYSQFVNAVKEMGTGFPIPTLGKESHFYVQIKNSCVEVINSKGKSYLFSEYEYGVVLERFCKAPQEHRFHAYYYARSNKGGSHYPTWDEGNPNTIFSGYLPALFRELYFRCGVSVIEDSSNIWNFHYAPYDLRKLNKVYSEWSFDGIVSILKKERHLTILKKKISISEKDGTIFALFDGQYIKITRIDFEGVKKEVGATAYLHYKTSDLLKSKFIKDVIKAILIEILKALIQRLFK